ncbi:hypothetical protein [Roseivivax isoporae]|uniref:Uncharacterized protein n=1 Tax=Roseivivax isoporae LMG 25204 TaxID=1449351 RepID=X7F148_9RHOB|nr:hypothetical protein [Roseivivax isoporae]ETX26617.1 hypothetical protein RISW2_21725 [Roseivivax isoporae LMG 25204]
MSATDQLPGQEPDRVALGRAMADDMMDGTEAKPDRAHQGAAFGGCLIGAVVFWILCLMVLT